MPKLLGIHVQNYRALSDVCIGQISYGKGEPLPELMCFIGPNGSGKSTLLDAFGFLADCLKEGVEAACDKPQRGGFQKLRTQGTTDPISFTLFYKETRASRPITYTFSIDEQDGVPVVISERLRQRRLGQKHGQPFSFLQVEYGVGQAWSGESTVDGEGSGKVDIALSDISKLAITSYGNLKEHPRISGLRAYIEDWYLSYFVPELARGLPTAGAQKHLNRTGENLANVVQYMHRSNKDAFDRILIRISQRIPGITTITPHVSQDRRLLLEFDERGYTQPFYQPNMSDGTLKMFAYLLLLEDPEPRAFIGIEEPENGLYHKLLEELARELEQHSARKSFRTQLLITTHSPYLVNALIPEQVWLLQKNASGTTEATRTSDMPTIKELIAEGIPLGSLWYSNHLDERELF